MLVCKRQSTNPDQRRGVAAVEFAVCLPMLILLFVGMIEACTMIFLKQSLSVAAYEGIHTGLLSNATAADIQTTCNAILTQRRVVGGQVVVTPSNLTTVQPGEYFTVRVSAPTTGNSFLPLRFFGNVNLAAEATMLKEL